MRLVVFCSEYGNSQALVGLNSSLTGEAKTYRDSYRNTTHIHPTYSGKKVLKGVVRNNISLYSRYIKHLHNSNGYISNMKAPGRDKQCFVHDLYYTL